jgi:hypothetical protein
MRLYVGNIPKLANEGALCQWFERAGILVRSIELASEDEDRRVALVETQNDSFPLKDLRHLSSVAFWGQFLAIRRAGRAADIASRREMAAGIVGSLDESWLGHGPVPRVG